MNGYILTYKPATSVNRVFTNYALFGRIIHRKYKDKQYAYYVKGMLDNIEYVRLLPSKIFLKSLDGIDLDKLSAFSIVNVEEAERNTKLLTFETARQHWEKISSEKGLVLKISGITNDR